MKVTKFSGKVAPFDQEKLENSLRKSGADDATVLRVIQHISTELYDGIPTKKIYKLAFQKLKNFSNVHAARYNLRTALLALGPAGFFFEKFIARIFEFDGFKVQTNLFLEGKCVLHEVDIIIKNQHEIAMVECKFHGSQDAKTDVKVPMYILSRFNDLKDNSYTVFNASVQIEKCWIVTNNRFTQDAIRFALCSNLQLLSWDYPAENSLKSRIDVCQIYPITCLTTLSAAEKNKLLVQDIITVNELIHHSDWLEKTGVSSNRRKNVLREANQLCNLIN